MSEEEECPHCLGCGEIQCVNVGEDGGEETLPCPTCVSRELNARIAACGWQPIETAPKDGSHILLYRHLAPWDVLGWGYWVDDGDGVAVGWIARGFTDPPGNLGLAAPSHWQRLDPPPEAA